MLCSFISRGRGHDSHILPFYFEFREVIGLCLDASHFCLITSEESLAHVILIRHQEDNGSFGRRRYSWDDNIKIGRRYWRIGISG